MNGGVFAVSRGIFEDPDFAPEPFTQREAFMWLVGNAAWKSYRVRGTKGPITLGRGEFYFSVRFLALKWKWSKSRVTRFLDMLKNRDIIEDTDRDGSKVWKINKYKDFQKLSLPKRDTSGTPSGTEAGHERDKEETKINQEKPCFSAQGAKKKNGFVKMRTSVDAAHALIERRGISDGRSRTSEDGAITGDDVQLISSVGGR